MTRQQRLVLAVSILASFVAFIDGAIVNVALPSIQRELGGGLSAQQWIVDAYLLTLGSFILIAGSLSDLLGRKRILRLGLIGFGAASLLCAAAPSSELLVLGRALQGIAGALVVPSSLALIISAFSGPAQGKAIGTWTAWTGISFIIGPVAGGLLVDHSSWRWIFAINVVPIAITMLLMKRIEVVKEERTKTKVDIFGALLCALGLGGPVYALIEQPHLGWDDPRILVSLIGGLVLFAGFLVYESRVKAPMLPLSLFAHRNFSVGNVATVMIYAGLTISTFLIVVFLQQVAGYTAVEAGMALLPVTLIMFLLSPRIGALSAKYGPRLFMGAGPLIAGVGFLMMLGMDATVNYWTDLFPAVLVFGLGLSTTVAPTTSAILGDVLPRQAGIASAINNAVARVAGLVAIAAVGAVIAAAFSQSLDSKRLQDSSAVKAAKMTPLNIEPPTGHKNDVPFKQALTDASVSAFHAGILVTALLVMSGGIISLVGIRNPTRVQ